MNPALAQDQASRTSAGEAALPESAGAAKAASLASARRQALSGALPWHDQATMLGVNVKAHFFNPAVADAQADPALRALPVLLGSSLHRPLARPEVLAHAGDALPRYQVGALWAVPDLVLRHGGGLISVMRQNGDIRQHEPRVWRDRLRSDLMLQCLATAMAVSDRRACPPRPSGAPGRRFTFSTQTGRCWPNWWPSCPRWPGSWGRAAR